MKKRRIHKNKMRLQISPWIFLLLPWIFLQNQVFLYVLYLLFLCLHEGAHAFVAARLGYKSRCIKLSLCGATLEGSFEDFLENDEIKIALAGPCFNLCIAGLVMCFWWIWPISYSYTLMVFAVNISIAVVNLLPCFPLDGGRVLLGIFAKKMQRKVAVCLVKYITIAFSIVLFLLCIGSVFFTFQPTWGIFAIVLFSASLEQNPQTNYQKMWNIAQKQAGLSKGLKHAYILISPQTTLHSLRKHIQQNTFTTFEIMDTSGDIVWQFEEDQLYSYMQQYGVQSSVSVIYEHMR